MVKIEAIAVDVDGTITDDRRRVCHSALDALRKAEDAGIPVIIATGNISHFTYAVATLVGMEKLPWRRCVNVNNMR